MGLVHLIASAIDERPDAFVLTRVVATAAGVAATYFALQAAYIGTDEERARGLETARALTAAFKAATTSALARDILDRALAAAEADECYTALKLARRIIRHEDAVLGRGPAPREEIASCMA